MNTSLDLLLKRSLIAPISVKSSVLADLITEGTLKNNNKIESLKNYTTKIIRGKKTFQKNLEASLNYGSNLEVDSMFADVVSDIYTHENFDVIQDFLCAIAKTNWNYKVPLSLVAIA